MAMLLAGPLAAASAARADMVSIGLREAGVNGGAITTVASGATSPNASCPQAGGCSWSGSYGTFTFNGIGGMGASVMGSPDLLDSTSMNTSSSAAGTLYVYVSDQGLVSATPQATEFESTFTENVLSPTMSVTESTYVDPANGLYALTAPLGGITFPPLPVGQPVLRTATADLTGPSYSVTEVYAIAATGRGSDSSTIDVSLPEPASLGLFVTALAALGLFGLCRKRV